MVALTGSGLCGAVSRSQAPVNRPCLHHEPDLPQRPDLPRRIPLDRDQISELPRRRRADGLLEYQAIPLEAAATTVVMDVLVKARGEGGVIAMDGEGHMAMVFNTKSMYRGFVGPDGAPSVAVFADR